MFQANRQIGGYTLIKLIWSSGFEEVWLAERRTEILTTLVAVKLHKEQSLEAIRQEAALWSKASGHSNVLPIIEANIYDGQVVIVSEFAPDGSLDQKLREVITIKQAVEIIIGILNGLDFIHARQILHRDIKPANIFLQGETPRLAGFGLSRIINTDSTNTAIVGAPVYMAPEVLNGKYSFQTDIWAVGIILYQMLSGNFPFPQPGMSDLVLAIMTKDPDPLPDSVPLDLQRIVSKALAKLPENRFQSAKEMCEDLQKIDFETIRQKTDSLFDILKVQGKFSVKEAVKTTIEILNDLDFLHVRQIIHCDIQPQNIIIQYGKPLLTGFGYLRLVGETDNIPPLETILYVSPEALNGELTVQTNIWSVGVVLYQLLSGNLPFPLLKGDFKDLCLAILTKDFHPLSDEIPFGLKDIVSKALAKKTENRYQSAKEMCEDLQKALVET